MKLFLTIALIITTIMVMLLSLTATAVLINNFGNIGFLIAPFFLLVVAAILVVIWVRFFRYLNLNPPSTPRY